MLNAAYGLCDYWYCFGVKYPLWRPFRALWLGNYRRLSWYDGVTAAGVLTHLARR